MGAGSVSTEAEDLEAHAGDWSPAHLIGLRRAETGPLPVGVFRPESPDQLAEGLRWADAAKCPVVPFGGGSSVCRGIAAADAVVIDMTAMNAIRDVDDKSLTVVAEAGVSGDVLRDELARLGLTIGHEPQSIAISTVGGWVATKACGQLSAAYGGIEDRVRSLEAVWPGGRITPLRSRTRSSTGPDVERLLIGSEGTLGIVTAVSLVATRARTERSDAAVWFDHMSDGVVAARNIAQSELEPAVLRLYDADDTTLFLRHVPEVAAGNCVMVMSFHGDGADARLRKATDVAGSREGDPAIAAYWWEHRNRAVDEYRSTMRGEGMLGEHAVVDTMEVSGTWSALRGIYHSLKEALQAKAMFVGCHLSHVYPDGACLYFTMAAPAATDDDALHSLDAWWEAGMTTCRTTGAAISHHHGIGRLKARWLPEEMGEWWHVLRAVKTALDPNRIMNPGALGL